MKSGLVFLFCIFLVISVSFVSAGFFSDLWNKITGNTITPNNNSGTTDNTNPTTSNSNRQILFCSDSDGGYNIFTIGTCTDSINGVITTINTDSCTNNSLREFYCNNSRCLNVFGRCPNGYNCINGACTNQTSKITGNSGVSASSSSSNAKPLCSDSDRGYNIFIRGTCTDSTYGAISNTNTDSCTNESLREFYCGNNSRCLNVFGSCPSGYVCNNGACIINDQTPPVIEFFNLSYNGGNISFIHVSAQAHDYESGMLRGSYIAVNSNETRQGQASCNENTCTIDANLYYPSPGLWNITITFENNVHLNASRYGSIYVPGAMFFEKVGGFFFKNIWRKNFSTNFRSNHKRFFF